VVRHDVEHEAHIVGAQAGDERGQVRLAPALGVELGRVDDVVPVGAAAPRPQQRRAVDVRDAERREVVDDLGGGGEGEAGVPLQPVRRGRGHGAP
jgi:hypothetical protein